MTAEVQKPELSEDEKATRYWQEQAWSVMKALRMHRRSGQLNKITPDYWRNVTEHCLVQVARVEVLGKWLRLSDELIADMKMAAALHDFSKKQEIEATRKANNTNQSPFAAVTAQHEESEKMLRKAGFSDIIIKLASSPGGLTPQLIDSQKIIEKDTRSDEDLALFVVRYVDDFSNNTDWVGLSEMVDKERINMIDYRMEINKAKGDYDTISKEVNTQLKSLNHATLSTMNNHDASAYVAHEIEKILVQRINDIGVETINNPLQIPELVDQKIAIQTGEKIEFLTISDLRARDAIAA